MSVHAPERDVLARLIRVSQAVIMRHHAAAEFLPVLFDIECDLSAATRCPAPRIVGSAELIVLAALMSLATEQQTAASAYRRTYLLQMFVEEMGEHFLAADRAARGGK
jgi:hypothetical protein